MPWLPKCSNMTANVDIRKQTKYALMKARFISPSFICRALHIIIPWANINEQYNRVNILPTPRSLEIARFTIDEERELM